MPLKNYKRAYLNYVVLFIQQKVFFDKEGFTLFLPPCSGCNPAGFVAVLGCSSRPLSANEFWEMVSEIRPLLHCIGLQPSAEEKCSRQQRPSQRQIQPCEAPSVYQ